MPSGSSSNNTASRSPPTPRSTRWKTGRVWQLNDVGNKILYTIRLETTSDTTQALTVYKPGLPASLVNAYMPNAILTGANLFGVTANNIQFYGSQCPAGWFGHSRGGETQQLESEHRQFHAGPTDGRQSEQLSFIQREIQ